jgi:hypothetical protein
MVTQSLPGGQFGFRFYYSGYGYATCASTLSVAIPRPTLPAIQASYQGGQFTLAGTGLSPSATLSIGGFKTSLSAVGPSQAVGTVPVLVNTLTQSQYGLASPQKLTAEEFSIISDNASQQSNAFDSLHGTVYSSLASACFIGIDVGPALWLNLTRIRLFPNSQWFIVADYLLGATIEASTDGSHYDVLATIDSTIHTGWNILSFSLGQNYRYFRFAHTSASRCQLAEL